MSTLIPMVSVPGHKIKIFAPQNKGQHCRLIDKFLRETKSFEDCVFASFKRDGLPTTQVVVVQVARAPINNTLIYAIVRTSTFDGKKALIDSCEFLEIDPGEESFLAQLMDSPAGIEYTTDKMPNIYALLGLEMEFGDN